MKRRDFLKVSGGGLGLAVLPNILEDIDPKITEQDFKLVYYWIQLLENTMNYYSIKYKDIVNINIKSFEFEDWDFKIPFFAPYGIIDIKTNYDNMTSMLFVFASDLDNNPKQQIERCIKLLKTTLNYKIKTCS